MARLLKNKISPARLIYHSMFIFIALLCLPIMAIPNAAYSAGKAKQEGNTQIDSFSDAKELLMEKVYTDHRRTLYCDSAFDESKRVIHDRGYVPAKSWDRAYKLEWEHVVPAEAFGKSFREWRDGDKACVDSKGKPFKGRKCAEKVSEEFRRMEADMYNLYPECGETNGLRSNYSFAMISGPADFEFGSCKTRISSKERKIEPRPEVRGDIARTYFYMDTAYPGHGIISDKNRKLFEAWDKQDPVDAWECERAKRIEKLQGNISLLMTDKCGSQ